MKKILYFIEFIVIRFFFILCKLLGYKISSNLGFYIGSTFGNIFRTKKSIIQNIEKSKISIDTSKNKIFILFRYNFVHEKSINTYESSCFDLFGHLQFVFSKNSTL